ncbi:hypothetical protein NPIL_301761 [Nephila pilipes]|uniref:Uncharacterized protein n=1 Tax=Nephila pilipes TaxID=299642 RepID=A0A8X6PIW2_NEPPI|nr:hypothetical protein NPIL_301761 [Nephila pilipes]
MPQNSHSLTEINFTSTAPYSSPSLRELSLSVEIPPPNFIQNRGAEELSVFAIRIFCTTREIQSQSSFRDFEFPLFCILPAGCLSVVSPWVTRIVTEVIFHRNIPDYYLGFESQVRLLISVVDDSLKQIVVVAIGIRQDVVVR